MASPRDEVTIGNAPYVETAAINAARHRGIAGLLRRIVSPEMLQATTMGFGSVPPQARGWDAFAAGLSGGARARTAMDQQRLRNEYQQREDMRREQGYQLDVEREARLSREKPEKKPKTIADEIAEVETALGRKLTDVERNKVAGVYIPPRKPAGPPKTPAEEKSRIKKRDEELSDLVHADPAELSIIATDSTLEPETNRKAMQILKRMQSATTPSQVDQGLWTPPKDYKTPYVQGR